MWKQHKFTNSSMNACIAICLTFTEGSIQGIETVGSVSEFWFSLDKLLNSWKLKKTKKQRNYWVRKETLILTLNKSFQKWWYTNSNNEFDEWIIGLTALSAFRSQESIIAVAGSRWLRITTCCDDPSGEEKWRWVSGYLVRSNLARPWYQLTGWANNGINCGSLVLTGSDHDKVSSSQNS